MRASLEHTSIRRLNLSAATSVATPVATAWAAEAAMALLPRRVVVTTMEAWRRRAPSAAPQGCGPDKTATFQLLDASGSALQQALSAEDGFLCARTAAVPALASALRLHASHALLLLRSTSGVRSVGSFAKHFCSTIFVLAGTSLHRGPSNLIGRPAASCKLSSCSRHRSRPCGRRPVRRRCMHKPTAQTSLNSHGASPNTTSGAEYNRVPVGVNGIPSPSCRATLKSMSFNMQGCVVAMESVAKPRAASTFCGLMSRCTMRRSCKCCTAATS
mmetsp:Transcript_124069/g.312390  ORF Transcript_124069/g.312390 Transcript_124069/m.312390 type:complete len:273 (-) Transcript_124069:3-821(-)